jgi:Xaa-Pro dipeptidase
MRDFDEAEFEARLARAHAGMEAAGFDALLLTSEAEIRWFTGFRTLFWQSPTRPWFLVVPAHDRPVAVIPSIGAELMAKAWIGDLKCWSSPAPQDEGVSLLADTLKGFAQIGLPMGEESALRMALVDFRRLEAMIPGQIVNSTPLIRALREVKSPAEIAVIEQICGIGSTAFARAADLFREGQTLAEVFRAFKIALLEDGAEDVPYLVGGAGPGGYGDVISPPDARPLAEGDVLMLDTGATLKGYFCDFDRNWAIGRADPAAASAYRALWTATEAGIAAARPGATAADLFDAMQAELPQGGSAVGRAGHGLGMQLTEWPSVMAGDTTVMRPGMVMTLEPSMEIGPGRMMVHEENILITEGAPRLLTRRAAPELPVI